MATTYTDNFLFPLLSDGSSNWGAVANGAMETLDIELKAAQSPLVSLVYDQTQISLVHGEIVLQHYQI
jgi:hypothetical protein